MLLFLWLLLPSSWASARDAVLPPEGQNFFPKHECCRQVHHVYVGDDFSGDLLSVDVGLCLTHCRSDPYDLIPGLAKLMTIPEFVRAKQEEASQSEVSCGSGRRCEGSRIRVEEFVLRDGIHLVEVIEACHCAAIPPECLRVPAPKTFFHDSPMEQSVNVGRCNGPTSSSDGLLCVPTRFNTILLKGPNGNQAVQTVEHCEWRESCYRVSHYQTYIELVAADETGKEMREQIKEIDVGLCLGRCSPGNPCLPRGWSREKCSSPGKGASGCCIPESYTVHSVWSRSEHYRAVFSIETCTCSF